MKAGAPLFAFFVFSEEPALSGVEGGGHDAACSAGFDSAQWRPGT